MEKKKKKEALESISIAKKYFPGRTSLDMIWGRPSQTIFQWELEFEVKLNLI